jgi:hypothetical protein
MKFKVGDRVENIINKRKGIVTVISKTEDIDKFNGQFKQTYYVSYDNCTGNWHTMVEIEKVEEILDEKEKEYLSNIIKPFKDRVKFIIKRDAFTISNCEFIIIEVLLPDDISRNDKGFTNNILLPMFKKNTMYKGMQAFKKYTLKELNLD